MGDERRKQPRFAITGPIVLMTDTGDEVTGVAADASVLGFRFHSNALLDLGEKVTVTLRSQDGQTHPTEGIVRHATETAPYCYGVAFTDETVQRLIRTAFGDSG